MNEQEKRATDSSVCFGSCRLDVKQVQVWRDHHEVKLTGKAFAVLCYFVDHPGQLVTKDDLFAAAWPETIISDATLASCIQEVRQALGDDAKQPRYIETVHRRGFRFIAEVVSDQLSVVSQDNGVGSQEAEASQNSKVKTQKPALSVVEGAKVENSLESSVQSPESEEQKPVLTDLTLDPRLSDPRLQTLDPDVSAPSSTMIAPRRWRWWQVLLLLVVLVLGGGLVAKWRLVRLVAASYFPPPAPEPLALPLPDKPSLVVLPLVNLSGDTSQEYFSDGLTDDLISTLAQFPDLFIVARQSAFTYKGKTIKEQDVGKELGVRYVLTGSVRRAGGQVRVNVQIVDAITGGHLWVEQYERAFADLFTLQDEIVRKIATTMKLQLENWKYGGSLLRKTTPSMEAWDALLRGQESYWSLTPEGNLRARQLYEKAVTLDPQYALAYACIGWTYFLEWVMQWNPDPQNLERALEYGQKAVALDDLLPESHHLLAEVYARNGQLERALSEIELAINLAPNYADSYNVQAEILILAGRPTEALQSIQQAIRLSPPTPPAYLFMLGWVYHVTERYAESITALKQFLVWIPFHPGVYPLLVYNYTAQWIIQQSHDPKLLDQAYDAAQNAIALSAALPWSHTALGFVYLWQKQYDRAIAAFEQAVVLDENFVCGQMQLAFGLSQVGRVEEAVQVGERALSLKALPSDDLCLYGVASAYALAGRLEEAAALYLRMLRQFPNSLGFHLHLAAIYSELGRETEAQAAAAEVLRLNPKFSLEVHRQRVPLKDPAVLERHIAALRKAGLR